MCGPRQDRPCGRIIPRSTQATKPVRSSDERPVTRNPVTPMRRREGPLTTLSGPLGYHLFGFDQECPVNPIIRVIVSWQIGRVAAAHNCATAATGPKPVPGGSCQGFLATSAPAATGNSGRRQSDGAVPSPKARLVRRKVLGSSPKYRTAIRESATPNEETSPSEPPAFGGRAKCSFFTGLESDDNVLVTIRRMGHRPASRRRRPAKCSIKLFVLLIGLADLSQPCANL